MARRDAAQVTTTADIQMPLVVVGGGLAGTAAAIAAARNGTKTILIQERPVLGGNSSSEIRVNPVGAAGSGYRRDARETGIMEEIFLESRARSFGLRQINGRHYPMWDVILSELAEREPNLTLMLNTRVISVKTSTSDLAGYENSIAELIAVQQGTEAVLSITPGMVIDATGDGFIAVQAGALFRYGREARAEFGESMAPDEADDVVLGSTIMFAARDAGRPVPYSPPSWAHSFPDEESLPFRYHEQLDSGYWWIELGGRTNTITNNETIRKDLHAAVFGVWDHIKNHCTVPGVREKAATWTLDWIGHLPGKRESRRFEGDHILTQQDLVAGLSDVPFDTVTYGGWPIDLHAPDGIYSSEHPCTQPQPPTLYGIPLRSLYSRTVSNLFMAGRNISQTHVAHGSTRVMKTCAVIGEAAGTAASQALTAGLSPRELVHDEAHLNKLQQRLLRNGGHLPLLRNEDPGDLVLMEGVATSSSSQATVQVDLDLEAPPRWELVGLSTGEVAGAAFLRQHQSGITAEPLNQRYAQTVVISGGRIDAISLPLVNRTSAAVEAFLEIRSASHLRDFGSAERAAEPLARVCASVPPGTSRVSFPIEHPITVAPGMPVALTLDPNPQLSWQQSLQEPPGTQASRWDDDWGWWRLLRGTLAFEISPVSTPYGPENVTSGATRPEVGSNLWISDPRESLPQWLELSWPAPQSVSSVELTFDSQLSGWIWEGAFPAIARSYSIETCNPATRQWECIVQVRDNYQRRRVHVFPSTSADHLRVMIHETNGGQTARIVEIRAYDEPDGNS